MEIRSVELEVVYLKVNCPKCGKQWGIRISEKNNLDSIPMRDLLCNDCLEKGDSDHERRSETTKRWIYKN